MVSFVSEMRIHFQALATMSARPESLKTCSQPANWTELNWSKPVLELQLINVVMLMPNSHRPPDKTRRSCLCRIRRCELSRPDKCVLRRSASSGRTAPPDTLRHRTHLSGGRADSVHTATPDTTKQSSLCLSGVNWIWRAWPMMPRVTGSTWCKSVQFSSAAVNSP